MGDQQHILNILRDRGPLERTELLRLAKESASMSTEGWQHDDCLTRCETEGIVTIRDGVVYLASTCPCCDGTELMDETTTRTYTPPFGHAVEYEVQWHRCHDCTEAVQASGQSEHIQATIHQADQDGVKVMLADLAKAGIEPPAITHMLRLPKDTIQRWNDGTATPAEIVVLRLVRAFPMILVAAANNYAMEARTNALIRMLQSTKPAELQDMSADYAALDYAVPVDGNLCKWQGTEDECAACFSGERFRHPLFHCWRLDPNARMPTRAHDTDVGYDVTNLLTESLAANEYRPIRTGLVIQPPPHHYFELVPRSSTFKKFGLVLANSIGIVDPTYCGPEDEIMGLCLATRAITIPAGTRLFQIIPRRLVPTSMTDATGQPFPFPSRGGVGSTGT